MFPTPLLALRNSNDERVREVLENIVSVVETGGGVGFVTEVLGALYPKVTVIEKTEKLIEVAKDYIHNLPHVEWVCGDSEDVLNKYTKNYTLFHLHAVKTEPVFYDNSTVETVPPKEGDSALPQELKIISNAAIKCIIVTPVETKREDFEVFGDRLIHHEVISGVTYAVIY